MPGDPVGIANRVFRQLYRVRLGMKRLKRRGLGHEALQMPIGRVPIHHPGTSPGCPAAGPFV